MDFWIHILKLLCQKQINKHKCHKTQKQSIPSKFNDNRLSIHIKEFLKNIINENKI